jgi:hypothetical protein
MNIIFKMNDAFIVPIYNLTLKVPLFFSPSLEVLDADIETVALDPLLPL